MRARPRPAAPSPAGRGEGLSCRAYGDFAVVEFGTRTGFRGARRPVSTRGVQGLESTGKASVHAPSYIAHDWASLTIVLPAALGGETVGSRRHCLTATTAGEAWQPAQRLNMAPREAQARTAQPDAFRSRGLLAEPLTPAELRVLKLLPTSTYLQMAEVSPLCLPQHGEDPPAVDLPKARGGVSPAGHRARSRTAPALKPSYRRLSRARLRANRRPHAGTCRVRSGAHHLPGGFSVRSEHKSARWRAVRCFPGQRPD